MEIKRNKDGKKLHPMFQQSVNFHFAGSIDKFSLTEPFEPTSCRIVKKNPDLPYYNYTTIYRPDGVDRPLVGIPILTDLSDDDIIETEKPLQAWVCVYGYRKPDIMMAMVTIKDDSYVELTEDSIIHTFTNYIRRISEKLYDELSKDKIGIQKWESVT